MTRIILHTSSHVKGVLMEYLPVIGLVLGVYAAFVVVFFRFLTVMRQKEETVVRQGGHRS